MGITWLHVIANLPHAWHVTTWHHGWYVWRAWHHTVMTFGKSHGVTCGYLRTFKRVF